MPEIFRAFFFFFLLKKYGKNKGRQKTAREVDIKKQFLYNGERWKYKIGIEDET